MTSTAFRLAAVALLMTGGLKSFAQTTPPINVVTTAVPFLRISPDARAGGMGDLSLATEPDAASSYYNLGKVPFNTSPHALNLTYTPWLKKIVPDVYLAALSGYHKFNDNEAISASLRYFNLGQIQFTDAAGNNLNLFNPREYGVDIGYSRKLGEKTGFGVALKYIYSNLAGTSSGGNTYKAGTTVAGDIGFYHSAQNDLGQGWAFGAALTNLGGKISYTDNADQKDYIPANLGIGTTYTSVLDESNKISFGLDINKLLVPTPPSFQPNPNGDPSIDSLNQVTVANYRSKSVVSSWFSSLGDAPGGFSEELREFQVSVGGEYSYNNQFALRGGYFYENKTKGNRRFFTAGVGLKYNVFGLNFSYLVPTGQGINQNPLSNTLRFSLVFDLSGDATGGGTTTSEQ